MNLHEYQSKELFRAAGIPVPPAGKLVTDIAQLPDVEKWLPDAGAVVKAQVHAGGRGKGGGVKLVRSKEELQDAVKSILGMQLVTPQTGAEGLPVERVYVEDLTDIDKEFYLGMLVDRAAKRVAIVVSPAGGMSIEEVAHETPELIFTGFISPSAGLQPYLCRKLGFALGLDKAQLKVFSKMLHDLYRVFKETDSSLIEINPLVVTGDGDLLALDAKVNLDSNALFRHKELLELRDVGQEDEREVTASEHSLNYIPLDGDIGCMVNGAGLAMATMDLIKLRGGDPANFLDVGGGATADRVAAAFKLILSDGNVKAVLVNIFGGIVRCDLIAKGILQAIEQVNVNVPVVVRLEGTKSAEGRALLADTGLAIIPAENLSEAATAVVAAAKGTS